MIKRALTLMLLACALTPATAMAQGQSPAAATLSSCLQTTGRLDVVFMIDEHQSIRFTDPLGLRVDGVDAALAGLARLAQTTVSGRKPIIKVLLEGFGGIVIPNPNGPGVLSDWMRVNPTTIGNVLAAANQYRSRHAIEDTDFALALNAARTLLAREAVADTEAGGPPPCKALIWFTNGRYLITDRNQPFNEYTYMGLVPERNTPSNPRLPLTEPYAPGLRLGTPGSGKLVQAAGARYLCRPGGVMDGLQSDHVVKFTFGLTQLMSSPQQAFLEALTTGRGPGVTCGTTLSSQTGQYLPISQDRCLLFVFAGLLDGTGCPAPRTPVCPKTACLRGLNAFRTIPGIGSFLIRADTGANAIQIALRGPDGRQVSFTPGSTTTLSDSGASLSQRWYSSRDVEITGTLRVASRTWIGPWSYAFVDPTGNETTAVPISQVELSPDLTPQLARLQVYRGTTTRLRLYFTDPAGNPVSSGALLDAARPIATLTSSQAGQTLAASVARRTSHGAFTIPVTVPAASTAPFVLLSVEVPFAIGTGAEVLPLERTFELPVALPVGQGFPSVTPTALNLTSISGTGTSTGILTVTASPHSGGCVGVGSPTYEAPPGTRSVHAAVRPTATASGACLPLAKGQVRRIRVSFSVRDAAAGTMNVTVPVHLHSALVNRTLTTVIAGSLALYPRANVGKRVAIIVALVVVGLLLPLALLLALNWLSGRFTAPQQISSAAAEVRLANGRLTDLDGEPVRIPPEQLLPVRPGGTDRRVRALTLETSSQFTSTTETSIQLRASAARSLADLFRGPLGLASAGGRPLVVGAERELRSWAEGTVQEIPLSLANVWLFLPSANRAKAASGPEGTEGRLVVLIRTSDEDLEAGQKLAGRAASALARIDPATLVPPRAEDGPSTWRTRLSGRRHRHEDDDWEPGWGAAEPDEDFRTAPTGVDRGERSPAGAEADDDGPGIRF